VAVFHLMTHAFFKALLFLAAGSVIIGMHHDQDIRNMGGLRKYMPITWITSLLGSLALIGTPLFSGFYSKDSIIEAVHASHLWGSGFAYFAVLAGVFVTAFYSFRMYFLVFHGKERFHDKPFPGEHDHHDDPAQDEHATAHHTDDDHRHVTHGHSHTPHESPWVVWVPLVLLAIPSVLIGYFTIGPMLHGDFFSNAIFVNATAHPAMQELSAEFHGAGAMALHGLSTLPFWFAVAGVAVAYLFYLVKPEIPAAIKARTGFINRVLENKYYLDWFNENVLSAGARLLGRGLWKGGDAALIDGLVVNGSARAVGAIASVVRLVQTGYLYWYALVMILGVVGLMTWQLWPHLSNPLGK
jgi:NADH-quinone oxidoreductase subunit L